MYRFFHLDRALKGNVSILVILVLLASSLMGILSMNFLRHLLSYTDNTYGYYKSYYMSKAGLELALTEIDNSGVGFSHELSGMNSIIRNNFSCHDCKFHMNVIGRSGFISNLYWKDSTCTTWTAFHLSPGESFVLPLFFDNTTNELSILGSDKSYKHQTNFSNLIYESAEGSNDNGKKLNLGIVIESGNDISLDYLFMKSYAISSTIFKEYYNAFDRYYGGINFADGLVYIIISNPNDSDIQFCLSIDSNASSMKKIPLASTKFFIYSIGSYDSKDVSLQAVYAQPIPSFFVNSFFGSNAGSMDYNTVSQY